MGWPKSNLKGVGPDRNCKVGKYLIWLSQVRRKVRILRTPGSGDAAVVSFQNMTYTNIFQLT